jgi:hypothetical protein
MYLLEKVEEISGSKLKNVGGAPSINCTFSKPQSLQPRILIAIFKLPQVASQKTMTSTTSHCK